MKMRLYKDKTNSELLRYYQKILRDAEDCKKLAEECGEGPAAEHFLKGARTATMEAEQVRLELEYRGSALKDAKFRITKPASLSPLQAAVLRKEQSLKQASHAFAVNMICWALEKTGGNQAAAARMLKMTRTGLVMTLKRYGLQPCQKVGRKGKSVKRTQEMLIKLIEEKVR